MNIKIRKLKHRDKYSLAKQLNNRKIWDNLRDYIPYPYHVSDAEKFIDLVNNNSMQKVFAIEYQDEFCGIISLNLQNDIYKKSAEIGYWLGEDYWHKGIASKAVQLIVNYGFTELNIIRIFGIVFENNTASMRVLKKNGFKNEGILKKAIYKNDKYLDEYRFFLIKQII